MITTEFYQVLGQGALYSQSTDASSGVYFYNLGLLEKDGKAALLDWTQAVEHYTASYNPCSPMVQIPKSKFALTNPANAVVTYWYVNLLLNDYFSELTRLQ